MRPIPNSPAYDTLRLNGAFRMGWEAAFSLTAVDNPFLEGTPQHDDWALGFKKGFTFDEQCNEASQEYWDEQFAQHEDSLYL